MKYKIAVLFAALFCGGAVLLPAPAEGARIRIEIGDRPYYRGPYYGPRHRRWCWVPGHWEGRRHHRVWIHGHYVRCRRW